MLDQRRRFAWITEGGVTIVLAVDEDEAYELAIAARMREGQTREEAEGWFETSDSIKEVLSDLP